ncbi:MAG: cobalamin biosynthesis protein CbiX [Opitutaceae bacterium]|nr:cobalamin biosynthesis protein CbiX [Opitutaceae bacterium]
MPTFAPAADPVIFLVDNGSLEPAATLGLRAIAESLGRNLGCVVEPVSLLHSSAIPAGQLGGQAAEILEPALERRLRAGTDDFLVVPLFFGPSRALADYLPRRITALKGRFPRLRVRLAPPLVEANDIHDQRLATILEDRVRAVLTNLGGFPLVTDGSAPAVILVDHGSPAREVAAVRDHLAVQLQLRLGSAVRSVLAASMERRPGPDYAFADPLLEHAFDQSSFNAGPVIVTLLFFSPGRHAGPEGDVAKICAAARRRHPQLHTVTTEPVGSHPGLISLLADRVRTGLARAPL